MLDLLTGLMEGAPAGVHVEARQLARREERTLVRNGRVDRVDAETAEGLGVRVRANGAWAFAATADVSRRGAEKALGRALELAEALPRTGDAPLAALGEPARGHWSSPWVSDPLAVSLSRCLPISISARQRPPPRALGTRAPWRLRGHQVLGRQCRHGRIRGDGRVVEAARRSSSRRCET